VNATVPLSFFVIWWFFSDVVSRPDYIPPNGGVISERQIGKDAKERGHCPVELLCRCLTEGLRTTTGKPSGSVVSVVTDIVNSIECNRLSWLDRLHLRYRFLFKNATKCLVRNLSQRINVLTGHY
jgi:hypothetical protein